VATPYSSPLVTSPLQHSLKLSHDAAKVFHRIQPTGLSIVEAVEIRQNTIERIIFDTPGRIDVKKVMHMSKIMRIQYFLPFIYHVSKHMLQQAVSVALCKSVLIFCSHGANVRIYLKNFAKNLEKRPKSVREPHFASFQRQAGMSYRSRLGQAITKSSDTELMLECIELRTVPFTMYVSRLVVYPVYLYDERSLKPK
jgi:hypothetical protein